MVKSDSWIEKMAKEYGMIEPFEPTLVREGKISYGLSSYGYDIRVADEYYIFTNIYTTVVDPKNFDERSFVYHK
jgi:dCTP deaminase